jgi:hypothetical protein
MGEGYLTMAAAPLTETNPTKSHEIKLKKKNEIK